VAELNAHELALFAVGIERQLGIRANPLENRLASNCRSREMSNLGNAPFPLHDLKRCQRDHAVVAYMNNTDSKYNCGFTLQLDPRCGSGLDRSQRKIARFHSIAFAT
jgi:hypothetical protein